MFSPHRPSGGFCGCRLRVRDIDVLQEGKETHRDQLSCPGRPPATIGSRLSGRFSVVDGNWKTDYDVRQ